MCLTGAEEEPDDVVDGEVVVSIKAFEEVLKVCHDR